LVHQPCNRQVQPPSAAEAAAGTACQAGIHRVLQPSWLLAESGCTWWVVLGNCKFLQRQHCKRTSPCCTSASAAPILKPCRTNVVLACSVLWTPHAPDCKLSLLSRLGSDQAHCHALCSTAGCKCKTAPG
jgi:hypothetical protein